MAEACQLVQVVRHSCEVSESFHGILRQGFPDISVHGQFIDDLGEWASCSTAPAHQLGVIRTVEIDLDGTVTLIPVGQSRPASLPAFRVIFFGMCPVHKLPPFLCRVRLHFGTCGGFAGRKTYTCSPDTCQYRHTPDKVSPSPYTWLPLWLLRFCSY